MAIELVVTQPFGDRQVGDVITGDDMDAAQKASPHCVVRRTAAEKPAEPPAPPAEHHDA